MDRTEAEAAVAAYNSLVEKAITILNDNRGPPWGYVGRPEWARISFEGDDVVVSHPDATTFYDSATIETDVERFPAALLFMSEVDLAAWKFEARRAYDEKVASERAAAAAKKEAEERAQLEALKRKYENQLG